MPRRIRYHDQFRRDLADRVAWLRRHRPPEHVANLREALRTFVDRVLAFPGGGQEVRRRGTISYRVRLLSEPLPYLVWYSYDEADASGPVLLLMLMHEAQDRERFDAARFE